MAVNAPAASDPASTLNALASKQGSAADSEQRFLKLLVTQLNNQDPLNPLDNAQLTSQLAQMSTVSGIEKLNGAVQSLLAQSGASQVLQSAALIGRTVLVPGKEAAVKGGVPDKFGIDIAGAADAVKVSVKNAAGEVVRTFDLGALPAGVKMVDWDGKSDTGAALPDGNYSLSVTAKAGKEDVLSLALTYAKVASVAQVYGGASLDLGGGRKAGLDEVRQVL
ncbi:flagellar hook assembly protein FlgD [Polaromonas sp. JS666]|uniref:flagellar hook assembly protein FlgD n=1 Tax=Polaromonas sp. (strain JS666 / ATCC BAA-500) TaxID=296591 RepID=UPI0008861762|nr:flagellar hook assembly protein FlgD [Polaromonas sp. JS666]SDN41654.1 flagellar basal-body rod modification protein FlgD [Polaromonas sp. JS666]